MRYDEDFYARKVCLPCLHGHPRPGSAEEQAIIDEGIRIAEQDEADYRYDQEAWRDLLANPEGVDPAALEYARAAYDGPLPAPPSE